MNNTVINLKDKLSKFTDHWSPKLIGDLNGQKVLLAKLKGEFVWHKHDDEDELFQVLSGELIIELENKTLHLTPGEIAIIPKGTMHKPVAKAEVEVLLFEPIDTISTGDAANSDLTKKENPRV